MVQNQSINLALVYEYDGKTKKTTSELRNLKEASGDDDGGIEMAGKP